MLSLNAISVFEKLNIGDLPSVEASSIDLTSSSLVGSLAFFIAGFLGSKKPKKSQTSSTKYVRNPEVVAWVLNFANGICECCKKSAPFIKEDGDTFLEVHHLKQLADGGSDTTTNAIAVCPNCHRELHFGKNKSIIKMKVFASVKRLINE